jgi:DNA-binding MarR family transcriptional regulator
VTTPPTAGTDLDELAGALERLGSWLRRTTPRTGWNAVATATLAELDRHGPQRVSDLVAQQQISQPGMTAVVGRLAAAGFVARTADPRDGRATLVSVTGAGRDYLRELHDQRALTIAAHLRTLPAGELRTLLAATGAVERLAARPISDPPTDPRQEPEDSQ